VDKPDPAVTPRSFDVTADLFSDSSSGGSAAELTNKLLLDTRNRAGMLLEGLPVGLLIHTAHGILYTNEEVTRLLGLSPAELIGHHLLDFVQPNDLAKASELLARAFEQPGERPKQELSLQSYRGDRVVRVIAGRLDWEGNPVIQVVLQDITELKHVETSLRRLTITDELTGAYNRRHAFYEASLYLGAERTVPLSAVLFDVDHFKAVNDKFGHAAGDAVLVTLTRAATNALKAATLSDAAIFCRVGGEEFVAVLPGSDMAEAISVAELIRLAARTSVVQHDRNVIRITVSAGVGEFNPTDGDFEGLLSRCDAALYAAKALGRNCVIPAVKPMS
jgi:diguanylate cyclase (GGDEF)-like protein/PAS domain S-box-containing protein